MTPLPCRWSFLSAHARPTFDCLTIFRSRLWAPNSLASSFHRPHHDRSLASYLGICFSLHFTCYSPAGVRAHRILHDTFQPPVSRTSELLWGFFSVCIPYRPPFTRGGQIHSPLASHLSAASRNISGLGPSPYHSNCSAGYWSSSSMLLPGLGSLGVCLSYLAQVFGDGYL